MDGIANVTATPDGMLQRLIVQAKPDPHLRERVLSLLRRRGWGASSSVSRRWGRPT